MGTDIITIIAQALWIILPAYMANASAVIVGGGTPIDFGKKWRDGKRILGDGKTWRGLLSGAFLGMTLGFGLVVAAQYINTTEYNWVGLTTFLGFPLMIPLLFSFCFGALLGDIIESFFKRRLGIERGHDWYGFDQLDFLVGALLLSFFTASLFAALNITSTNWFFDTFSIWHILVLLILTPLFHFLSNFLHRRLTRKTQLKRK